MAENNYRKQLLKIYGSLIFCKALFISILIRARLRPGTFQDQDLLGKALIIAILMLGAGCAFSIIKILAAKESIGCICYYLRKIFKTHVKNA